MKEKIERLSKGIFEYEMPELFVSETELNFSVEAGMRKDGSIQISNDSRQRMKGILYVSGKILVLEKTDFIGSEAEIPYYVDASDLMPGEEHQGTISIISDCGERQIPFSIQILEPSFQSSIGSVRDLFQFANLARVNWQEAEEFFLSADFSKIILQKENRFLTAYEQLLKSTNHAQALEEFLILVHKKKRCDFTVFRKKSGRQLEVCHQKNVYQYEVGSEDFIETVLLEKRNWGYLNVSVSCDASYLSFQKTEYTTEDFADGFAKVRFFVKARQLSGGNHFTELVFSSGRKQIRFFMVFSRKKEDEVFYVRRLRKLECQLTKQYIGFRNNQLTSASFLTVSEELLDSVFALFNHIEKEYPEIAEQEGLSGKKDAFELYRRYLSIVSGKQSNSEELSIWLKEKKIVYERENYLYYCAILYLEAMKSRDRDMVEDYVGVIRSYYDRQKPDNGIEQIEYTQKNDLLLWFLLYMDRRFEHNKDFRYEMIRQHCQNDKISPVLLYEAAVIWNGTPAIVTRLTGFECQVMCYLIRNQMIKKETALQFAYLTDRMLEQPVLQLWILRKLYDKFQHKDILAALCRLLIRQEKTEEKYHIYFKQAVKEKLNQEEIYEYYRKTLPRTGETVIDQAVLLYYSYTALPLEEDCAFLYAYVVKHKNTIPTIYRTYRKHIEQFAIHQLHLGRISESLAVLYKELLEPSMIDEEMAQILPELLFTCRVECNHPWMKSVCVAHKEEETAQIIPLEWHDGKREALVSVYTENAEIFLLDEEGRRYLPGEKERPYPLIQAGNFLDICYETGSKNRKLLLYMWEKNKNYNKYDTLLIDLQKQISQMNGIRREMQNHCLFALVEYYYENYNVELLEIYLNAVNLRLLSSQERQRMLELMILRDMYDRVIESVEIFGCSSFMPAKRLSRLCMHGISSDREETDRQTLLFMGHFAFQNGRIEDGLLQYLADHYNGTTAQMYEIWLAAKERELETTSMEERLLAQMLFAESHIENSFAVFLSYCRNGMNRRLLKAYYAYCSYQYFVRGHATDAELFEMLKRESFLDNIPICILAMLKYYSQKKTWLETERSFVNHYVQKCVRKKLIFPFFKEFGGKIILPAGMLDKYYIEYRCNPKKQITIHYSCNSEEKMRTEKMEDIGYGIFVKGVILFYGESLQYFITEENEDGSKIVESSTVCHTETENTIGTTKYAKINEILMAQDMKDEKTIFSLLEQYYKEEYAIDRHFSPV